MAIPDAQAVLDAAHLEELEEAALCEINGVPVMLLPQPLTLADATEALRRIRYHRSRGAEISAEADAQIAPLKALIDQIEAWRREEQERIGRRLQFHEARLEAYYRLNPPTKTKTIKLPGGRISQRDQAPEWRFADEGLLVAALVERKLPFVRQKLEIDKAELKRNVRVADGQVSVITNDGEVLELPGVTVTPRPPVYKIEIDG